MKKKLTFVNFSEFERIVNNTSITLIDKTKIFASFARINTLYMIAKAGSGHIGSSFSSMDIFSWLYLNVLKKEDVFFSSKGHDAPGLYSVLIGKGVIKYDNIHKLRRLNGLPGHPDVLTTPCLETNTGSLGMGISKAKGMVRANRLNGKQGRVYVLTGDGELQEGQFWESLPSAANDKLDEITVIIDHNKIQSDTWVSDVSCLGDLERKLASFGWHVQRCNGNNIEEFSKSIEDVKKICGKPQIIIADTTKGSGVSFMEANKTNAFKEFYDFHSGAPSANDYDIAVSELIFNANKLLFDNNLDKLQVNEFTSDLPIVSQNEPQKLIPVYERTLQNLGEKYKNIVVLDADLMIDCGLLSFRNNYPERYIECGIAEQDMISQAGTLALKGKLPISHSFACFLATRANEQFFNNASEGTKCIYVGSLAGLLPSGPGHSHQMIRDISALGGIPGLTLVEPSCEEEVSMVLKYAVEESVKSTYIRLVSIPCDVPYKLPTGYFLEEGKGIALTSGNDAIIFSYGPVMLSQAYMAAKKLKKESNINVKVVNLPWLNAIDQEWLINIIKNIKFVFTIDNHLISGGQGERIGSVISKIGINNLTFRMFGLNEIPVCGQNKEVLSYYNLNSQGIINSILKVMRNN